MYFFIYKIRQRNMARPISNPVSESDSSQATVERNVNVDVGQILHEPCERVIEHYSNYGELLSVEVIIESDIDPFDDENSITIIK